MRFKMMAKMHTVQNEVERKNDVMLAHMNSVRHQFLLNESFRDTHDIAMHSYRSPLLRTEFYNNKTMTWTRYKPTTKCPSDLAFELVFNGRWTTHYSRSGKKKQFLDRTRVAWVRNNIRKGLQNNKFALQNGINVSGPVSNYLEHMQKSMFCLVPAGDGSWTFRFNEALAVGCIPVVVAGGLVLPYANIIDWSRFVLRLSENFDFSRVDLLKKKLFENHLYQQVYKKDICLWKNVVGNLYWTKLSSERQAMQMFVQSMRKKWENANVGN